MVHVKVLQLHSNHYHHHDHHHRHPIGITKTDRKALGIWWREDNLLSFLSFETRKSWEMRAINRLRSPTTTATSEIKRYTFTNICNDNGDNIITVLIWLWLLFVPLRFHTTTATPRGPKTTVYNVKSLTYGTCSIEKTKQQVQFSSEYLLYYHAGFFIVLLWKWTGKCVKRKSLNIFQCISLQIALCQK